MGRPTAVFALACVLATVPGVAVASTVAVDPVTHQAVFTGGGGRNDVDTSDQHPPFGSVPPFQAPRWLWIVDAAQDLTAGPGCVAGLPVWCQTDEITVNLAGGDDHFGPSNGSHFITVNGGPGQDHIQTNGLSNTASGGSGADWIRVGGNFRGSGYGDSGDDNIRSFASRLTILSGGSGDDLLYGERSENQLSGDTGDDDLILREDRIDSGTLTGGGGNDVMLVIGDPSQFSTAVTFSGGSGGDLMVGHRGKDTVSGDRGRDIIDVSGDTDLQDTVDCGRGADTVYADAGDVIAANCETVLNGPMPTDKRVDAALARLADAFGVTFRRA